MADLTLMRTSPLAQLEPALRVPIGGCAVVRELPLHSMGSLRLDPHGPALSRVDAALGLALPRACGDTATAGAHTALWLGPDEWLIVSTWENPAELADILTDALGDDSGSVVDVSANRTIVELSGGRAADLLAKGCPADLHPRSFGPGQAITTTLARIPVILWRVSDECFRLLPRSSFADYVARWLLDASREYTSATTVVP